MHSGLGAEDLSSTEERGVVMHGRAGSAAPTQPHPALPKTRVQLRGEQDTLLHPRAAPVPPPGWEPRLGAVVGGHHCSGKRRVCTAGRRHEARTAERSRGNPRGSAPCPRATLRTGLQHAGARGAEGSRSARSEDARPQPWALGEDTLMPRATFPLRLPPEVSVASWMH